MVGTWNISQRNYHVWGCGQNLSKILYGFLDAFSVKFDWLKTEFSVIFYKKGAAKYIKSVFIHVIVRISFKRTFYAKKCKKWAWLLNFCSSFAYFIELNWWAWLKITKEKAFRSNLQFLHEITNMGSLHSTANRSQILFSPIQKVNSQMPNKSYPALDFLIFTRKSNEFKYLFSLR